jgi:hypothetical protein
VTDGIERKELDISQGLDLQAGFPAGSLKSLIWILQQDCRNPAFLKKRDELRVAITAAHSNFGGQIEGHRI